jgi:hypothetical protein
MPDSIPPPSPPPAPSADAAPETGSVPFVVGRLGRDDRRLVVLEDETPPPIAGPFELRAVFSK